MFIENGKKLLKYQELQYSRLCILSLRVQLQFQHLMRRTLEFQRRLGIEYNSNQLLFGCKQSNWNKKMKAGIVRAQFKIGFLVQAWL